MARPVRMIVEIVFADNRVEQIEVHEDDDAKTLAREFLERE